MLAEQRGNAGGSKSGAVEMPGPAIPYSSLTSSPVYLEMRMALSTATGNIASLRARVAAQQERVAELEAQVDAIPEVENELRQMEREIGLMSSAHEYDDLQEGAGKTRSGCGREGELCDFPRH